MYIVTGTSRGIGYELASINAGHQVLAIPRKTPKKLLEHKKI
jgi:short-subunit dehydrogenase